MRVVISRTRVALAPTLQRYNFLTLPPKKTQKKFTKKGKTFSKKQKKVVRNKKGLYIWGMENTNHNEVSKGSLDTLVKVENLNPKKLRFWGQESVKQLANQVRKTIVAMSWGMHKIRVGDDGMFFSVNGMYFKGVVSVFLAPNDTFTITYNGKDAEGKALRFQEGVYVDELIEQIDINIESEKWQTAKVIKEQSEVLNYFKQ